MCVYLSIQEIICKYKYIYTQNEQLPYSTRKPLKESKTIDHHRSPTFNLPKHGVHAETFPNHGMIYSNPKPIGGVAPCNQKTSAPIRFHQ